MARTAQITSRKESGQTENAILYNTYFKVVTCPLWQYWLWSFQERDTKIERFAKNQLDFSYFLAKNLSNFVSLS